MKINDKVEFLNGENKGEKGMVINKIKKSDTVVVKLFNYNNRTIVTHEPNLRLI